MKKSWIFSFLIRFISNLFILSIIFVYFMIISPIFKYTALIASVLSIYEASPSILILITIVFGELRGALEAINGTCLVTIIYLLNFYSEKLESKDVIHKK